MKSSLFHHYNPAQDTINKATGLCTRNNKKNGVQRRHDAVYLVYCHRGHALSAHHLNDALTVHHLRRRHGRIEGCGSLLQPSRVQDDAVQDEGFPRLTLPLTLTLTLTLTDGVPK